MDIIDLINNCRELIIRSGALLGSYAGIQVGATPSEVIYKKNKMKLLHYLSTEKKNNIRPRYS